MRFSKDKPPIFDRLHKAFGVEWGKDLVIAYGDTIYHSKPLDPSVIAHEGVHLTRQQDYGVEQWYERYLRDTQFRLGEELLAYREQYLFIKDTVKDRNKRAGLLSRLANDLAGDAYGRMVDYRTALKLISAT